jgi:heat shock protein HslJ
MKYVLSLSLVLCLLLFNCKSQDAKQKSANQFETPLLETTWVLTKLNKDLVNLASPELEQPFIKLTAKDNGVGGNGGCNTYGGTFTLKENQHIEFSQLLATMRYCDDNGIERVFMGNLQKASSYTITNNILTLKDENGYILVTFRASSEKKN